MIDSELVTLIKESDVDVEDFVREAAIWLYDKVAERRNLEEIAYDQINDAVSEGKVQPWMMEMAKLYFKNLSNPTLSALANKLIFAAVWAFFGDKIMAKVDELLKGKPTVIIEPGPKPIPVPPDVVPLPKMRKFVPVGAPALLWQGHDNAPVAVSENGWIATVTGDGFYGDRKYESCLWKLPPHKDPMVSSNWIFAKGYPGKCYGLVYISNILYLLISDKGSGWEGMQNCRRLRVDTGERSGLTFQYLDIDVANWFVVQMGPGHTYSEYPENVVTIGGVKFAGHGHGQHNANYKTPIQLWRGDIRDIGSFKKIGIAKGINGPRNEWTTTMSITYNWFSRQLIAGGGDWTASQIYQCVTPGDNVLGVYARKEIDTFSPPMLRGSYKNGTRWTGVFTLCYFYAMGEWYRMVSGHNPSGDKQYSKDDSVWCQKVQAQI